MASEVITSRRHKPAMTLVAPKSKDISNTDQAMVALSSLFFVGGVVWAPAMYIWIYKKWKNTPDDKENAKNRKLYRNILIGMMLVGIIGPHRQRKVGEFLNVRNWRIWKAWMNYIAYEVVSEASTKDSASKFDMKKDQAIFAFVPHGIFPFSIAFAALPQIAVDAFGAFRPVVASATRLLPALRTLMEWLSSVDATRESVQRALTKGDRIGICPGGIAEMFEGYPKAGRSPNDECALLKTRKGFVRLALKNNVPLIPVYCFGGNKMFKRLQLPKAVEKISNFLRISIIFLFGKYGLPIPLQQRLLYVIGNPIHPPILDTSYDENSEEFREMVDKLHSKFCDELIGIFERHKHRYGWGHKTLRLV